MGSWEDLDEAAAHEAALAGESLLVTGQPGTGKSHWVARLCAELEKSGKRVSIIAKTHASVANMQAHLLSAGSTLRSQTADHFVHSCVKRGVCNADVLVVEECTMLNTHLWDEVAKFALLCPQILAVGDFRQFGPCADMYCGSPVTTSLEHSDLLRGLCGKRLVLTHNHRSDAALFEFYSDITEENFQEKLAQARQQFPVQGPARYSLCISHATRMAVNRKANLNQKLMQDSAIFLKAPASKEDNRPQSFWAWPGQELIGAGGRVRKGLFYTVISCDDKHVTVEGNGERLSLSTEMAAKYLRLPHALTYASCQGLSLPGVRLMDTDNPHFTWRHLYVGASRCTSSVILQCA